MAYYPLVPGSADALPAAVARAALHLFGATWQLIKTISVEMISFLMLQWEAMKLINVFFSNSDFHMDSNVKVSRPNVNLSTIEYSIVIERCRRTSLISYFVSSIMLIRIL